MGASVASGTNVVSGASVACEASGSPVISASTGGSVGIPSNTASVGAGVSASHSIIPSAEAEAISSVASARASSL